MNEALFTICEVYVSSDYYLGGSIPADKLSNARMNFPIPSNDEVIALINTTVFGSAKTGLAICTSGIRWKNGWTQETRKNHLPWDEFISVDIREEGSYNVELGTGNFFNTSGSSMKRPVVINLLTEIQEFLLDHYVIEEAESVEQESAPTSPPPPPPPATKWLVAIDGEQSGPFTLQEIKNGILNRKYDIDNSYVWKQGMDNWVKMSDAEELKEVTMSEMPPPPPM